MTTVKKLLILTLTVLLALVPLAGCGDTAPAGDDASIDYDAVYGPVLGQIYDTIMAAAMSDWDFTVEDGMTGVWEAATWADVPEDALNNVAYTMEDLSGDGVKELVICNTSFGEETADGWKTKGVEIIGLYTVKDGEPLMVLEGWGRNAYNMLPDGRIYNWGSGGAAYSMFGVGHLSEDGTEFVTEDFYFSYDNPNGSGDYGDILYYHNTTGEWGEEGMDEEISEDDYWQLSQDLTAELHEFDVTTMLKFAQDKGLPTNDGVGATVDLSDDNPAVRADWAEEVLADLGGSYYEYSFGDSANANIVFGPAGNEEVKNFAVLSLTLEDVTPGGVPIYDTQEVYSLGELTAEKPLLVHFDFIGDIPNNGIKYCDASGACHYFTVSESGYDGSVVLAPFIP